MRADIKQAIAFIKNCEGNNRMEAWQRMAAWQQQELGHPPVPWETFKRLWAQHRRKQ